MEGVETLIDVMYERSELAGDIHYETTDRALVRLSRRASILCGSTQNFRHQKFNRETRGIETDRKYLPR